MLHLKQIVRSLVASTLFWCIFIPEIAISQTRGPTYASPKTKQIKQIIEKVLTAHGGLNKWRTAKTMRFTGIEMYQVELAEGMSEWDRWGWSEQTFELATRRGYHDLFIEKARLGWQKNLESRSEGRQPAGCQVREHFLFYQSALVNARSRCSYCGSRCRQITE